MKRVLLVLALAASVMGASCTSAPKTPQQAVYAAKSSYEVALTAAVAYAELPSCEKTTPPCSDPKIVAQLKKAQPVARQALDAAESAVRTPGFGDDVVTSSVAAAQAALTAFVSITASLEKK